VQPGHPVKSAVIGKGLWRGLPPTISWYPVKISPLRGAARQSQSCWRTLVPVPLSQHLIGMSRLIGMAWFHPSPMH